MSEKLAELRAAIEEKLKEIDEMHGTRVEELNEESFNKVVESGKVVVVLYTAPWCQPCKAFEPLFEAIARRIARDERLRDKIIFAKVDTDANPTLADNQNVDRIPSVIIYYKGNPVDVIVGAVTEDELVRRVREVVEKVE